MEVNLEDKEFRCDQKVIIVSKTEVDRDDVYYFILDNLDKFREGSKILLLYGCHGERDGTIGNVDKMLIGTLENGKEKR